MWAGSVRAVVLADLVNETVKCSIYGKRQNSPKERKNWPYADIAKVCSITVWL